MKKLAMLCLLLAGMKAAAQAAIVSTLGGYLYETTRVTILDGAHPAYFYDLRRRNETAQGGFIDHILTHKFVTADIGVRGASGIEPIIVGGFGVKVDELVGFALPSLKNYMNSIIPESAQGFWKATFVGLDTGWNARDGGFEYAFHTGVRFPLGN